MKPEEQQILLAQWAGWRAEDRERGDGMMIEQWVSPEGDRCCNPPDTSSLDVLHEMEKKLTPHQRRNYPQSLAQVCRIGEGAEWTADEDWTIIHTTPAKRREALLRTLGLWKECAK